ncbi:MAG: hypothetical protein V2A34_09655 [Lentisphaerota bacterium]
MKTDYSPRAILRRLHAVDELNELCRVLAGPRRKKDVWKRTSRDVQNVAKENQEDYKGRP